MGLQPNKSTEFTIELMQGTISIFIPPYLMDLLKLKELKKNLRELLDNGYIHVSVSPWCTLVLYWKRKMAQLCTKYRKLSQMIGEQMSFVANRQFTWLALGCTCLFNTYLWSSYYKLKTIK